MYKFIALALAAAVTALPAGVPTTDLANGEFNGTSEDLVIVGERPSAYPGTPTGTESNPEASGESISFHIDGEKYGWVVTDVGHAWGNVHPVVARKGYHDDFKFNSNGGEITHDLTATTNHFMACDSNVNGVDIKVLAWGNPNYYSGLPEGCDYTTVSRS